MKVGIIGGGVAGLTCSYELQKKNIQSVIWEKEPFVGGRNMYNMGAVSKGPLYKHAHVLIEELGLESLYTPSPAKNFGLLYKKIIMKSEQSPFFMKFMLPKAKKYHKKLLKTINELNFDLENPSEEIKKLRNISFADYISDCPKIIKTLVVEPELNFAFEPDYNKIAADYGLHLLRQGLETTAGQNFVFEENLLPLTNVLEEKIKEAGNKIFNSANVTKVEQIEGGRFKAHYEMKGKKNTEEVDKVVFAAPLYVTNKLFPQLEIESDIVYNPIRCVFVKGEPKHDRKIIVGLRSKDVSNICMYSRAMPYEHVIITFDLEKEVNLDVLYKKNKSEIVGEKIIESAWPVRPPSARVPELKTKIKGAYLCGDFYYFMMIETSIATAGMVANMIAAEE